MDDFIVKHGSDAFHEALANAQTVQQWEKQFKSEEQQRTQITPRKVAHQIVESYRESWKYHLEQNTWRNCVDGKVWRSLRDEVFTKIVYSHLETLGIDYAKSVFIEDVIKFLKIELLEAEWQTFDRHQWIAFKDCVYEVESKKTHNHAPGFGFLSALEHNFPKIAIDPKSSLLEQVQLHAPTFYDWAMHSQKQDALKVLKLLAIINGVIKFRFHELQMFVHLQGVPGAGKGAFVRLLESIVGKSNRTSTRLTKLGNDYTIADIINAQLVICPDERKQVGEWEGLLNMTGGDTISYREIYKPVSKGNFYGTIVIVSNPPIFAGDTTGIDRRLCLVTFDVPLPNRDAAIEAKMQQEVPALTALALAMADEQVSELIRGTGASAIPDFKRAAWLHKTENDSVALFMEEMLVTANPESYVVVGNKSSGTDTLYGAYAKLCEDNNSKSLFTANNFKNHLLELCRDIGWNQAREAKQRDGQYRVYGARLRLAADTDVSISEFLTKCERVWPGCESSVTTPKPLENMGCDGCDNENAKIIAISIDSISETENFKKVLDPPKNSHTTHTPDKSGVAAFSHSSHTPVTPNHTQTELVIGVGRKADYCGEVVTIVGWENRGTKVQIEFSNRRMQYVKRGSLKPPKVN